MDTLAAYVSAEITVKNSRFIADLLPVLSQEEARRKLKEQKIRYSGAAHVVHAFIVGREAQIMGMSDDGEPSGTAGRPVLDVLKGRRCTNVLLTVTRYFGGILLGTGGLVKAYGNAAKAAVDSACFEPLIEKCRFMFSVPYALADRAAYYLGNSGAESVRETYTEEVFIEGVITAEKAALLSKYVTGLTNGRSIVKTEYL